MEKLYTTEAQGKHDVAKAESSFSKGIWLGKDSDSNEHLIATSRGAIKSRTIVIPSEKWNRKVCGTFNGYPWNQTRDSAFDPSFFLTQQNIVFQTCRRPELEHLHRDSNHLHRKGPRKEGPEDIQGQRKHIQETKGVGTSTCIISSSSG